MKRFVWNLLRSLLHCSQRYAYLLLLGYCFSSFSFTFSHYVRICFPLLFWLLDCFQILHYMYNEDIIEEDAILSWEDEKKEADESDKVFVNQAQNMTHLIWLKNGLVWYWFFFFCLFLCYYVYNYFSWKIVLKYISMQKSDSWYLILLRSVILNVSSCDGNSPWLQKLR